MLKRVKKSVKVLLGKESKAVTHRYIIDEKEIKSMDGMVAIVTGAIGIDIVYKLMTNGAKVIICARNKEKIDKLINQINNDNKSYIKQIDYAVLDVTDDIQIKKVFKEIYNKHGKIDILINNAGGQPGRVGKSSEKFSEQEIENIDLILKTNLRATMICCHEIINYMIKQKNGIIINMDSVIGIGGKSGMCEYAAAKYGILGFTKSLALELGKYNIRVNTICPGYINQTVFDGGSEIDKTTKNVLGRHGYTEEIAYTCEYIIKNKYITGTQIVVDGGRILGLFGEKD